MAHDQSNIFTLVLSLHLLLWDKADTKYIKIISTIFFSGSICSVLTGIFTGLVLKSAYVYLFS